MVFIVVIFFIKTKLEYKANLESSNNLNSGLNGEVNKDGLTYSSETIGNLVSRDTDKDGIPDWEEGLWGTDPLKKETTPGVPDSVAIEKLKNDKQIDQTLSLPDENNSSSAENINKTEKLSRELISTVSALSQEGALDQDTIDRLTSTLADGIKNSPAEKVFSLSDLKVIKNNNTESIKNYSLAMDNIYKKQASLPTVIDVLGEFAPDENTINIDALKKLDPIITDTQLKIKKLTTISIPSSIAPEHLEVVNSLQRLLENMQNIQLYETDTVVALGAISKYEENTTLLENAFKKLGDMVNTKLSN
jgi:hypothetical protein